MHLRLNESLGTALKRFLYMYRAEIAIGFCVGAIVAMVILWMVVFSAPTPEISEDMHAPERVLKPERVQSLQEVMRGRVGDLEKVSKWKYSNPFAPRQGTSTVPQ